MVPKRVVLKVTEPRLIQTDNLSNEKIYAAQSTYSSTSKVEIIIICRYNNYLYNAVPLSSYYPQHYGDANSLKGIVESMLKRGLTVYEFDNEADFARWIGECSS